MKESQKETEIKNRDGTVIEEYDNIIKAWHENTQKEWITKCKKFNRTVTRYIYGEASS